MSDLKCTIQFNKDEKPLDYNKLLFPEKFRDQFDEVLKGLCGLEIELLQGETIIADGHVEYRFQCSKEKEELLVEVVKKLFECLMNCEKFKHN